MDPVLKLWLYHQWLGDHRDDAELAKNHAYLLGSFWNPEAVKELMNRNVHESSDEDFEKSLQIVSENDTIFATPPPKKEPTKKRRRKATLKG